MKDWCSARFPSAGARDRLHQNGCRCHTMGRFFPQLGIDLQNWRPYIVRN